MDSRDGDDGEQEQLPEVNGQNADNEDDDDDNDNNESSESGNNLRIIGADIDLESGNAQMADLDVDMEIIDDENDESSEADLLLPPLPPRTRSFRGLLRPMTRRSLAAGIAGYLSMENGVDLDNDDDDELLDDDGSLDTVGEQNDEGDTEGPPPVIQLNDMTEVASVLQQWEEKHGEDGFDPAPYLSKLAEIVESETEQYLRLDPDPFDDRHPCRTHPNCALGHSLKILFKSDTFMSKLVHEYLGNSFNDIGLNTAACRLFIDILPGLETSVVYQETEGLVMRLFEWAENGPEPLKYYALGLLGASMELPDVASKFRDKNTKLVEIILSRIKVLQNEHFHPFAQFSKAKGPSIASTPAKRKGTNLPGLTPKRPKLDNVDNELIEHEEIYFNQVIPALDTNNEQCSSSSSWAELEPNIVGAWKVHPLSLSMKQILSLRYLSPLGEYQEMLGIAFSKGAAELILNYLDVHKTKDSRLTFEALKYLSALLCHKKFAVEFIRCNGLQKLLQVPRPSVSATGVSLSLYYIAYCQDAMERVCQMSKSILLNLINYVMWLLECSHTSGRNHALMFFGVVYPFKVMLDLFDSKDGLRTVLNIISTQPDFRSDDKVSEEDQVVTRQVVRHVCNNLKRYFECHLSFLAEKLRRTKGEVKTISSILSPLKAVKHNAESLREANNFVLENFPLWARWHPVDRLIKLGGLHILMQAIALAYDWTYSGRAETVKCVLEVLGICCLVPRVQVLLTERFNLAGNVSTSYGLSIILSAAEGEVAADPDVQRSALVTLGNCMCGPLDRTGVGDLNPRTQFLVPRTPVRKSLKSSEELLNRIWECVRVNNGILILTRLLFVKTPMSDADSLRAFACWCLSGLARYQPVCQVLEQLPLMRNGLLHVLMREPILEEKRYEHVLFQKYGLKILKLVYGQEIGVDYALSMVAIHKADMISQTKIEYNEKQLLELIHEHFRNKGLHESAKMLEKETGVNSVPEISNQLTPATSKGGKTRWYFPSKLRPREVTLDKIVKEYLANQHSLCKTPMIVCPTFDLVHPHQCPAPRTGPRSAKLVSRCQPFWQTGTKRDLKFIYSKFKPFRTIRAEQDQFTSCSFSSCHQWVIVGTQQGQVKLFNNATAIEDGTYACHDSEIYNVQPNLKGSLLLTSSIWRRPLSGLWRMEGLFDKIIEFEREEYVEFSKFNQDKVIGTNIDHAYIYDIETTKKIFTLEPKISNQYHKNRATFDPSDDLVLSDGVLWDVRAGTEIHKFDKLNENINGVFHPNGLEIISNSEVWDVRTFKILSTVKSLDQSFLTFSNNGHVIYGIKAERESTEGFKAPDTSFVILDATDYSSIGTYEIKKSIVSLATSPNDLQIALIETHGGESSDSCLRYYDLGRSKLTEEGEEDEDDVQSHESEEDNDENEDEEDENDEDLDVDRLLDELLPEDETFDVDSQGEEIARSGDEQSDGSDEEEVEEYEVAGSSDSESDDDYVPPID